MVGRTIPSAGAAPAIDEAARYACAPRHEKEGPDVLTDIEIAQATEPKPIGEIAAIAGGKGGGKPDFAMAGLKDETKIDEALAAVGAIVKKALGE